MEKINNQEKIQRLSKLSLFNGVYGISLSSVTHGNGKPWPTTFRIIWFNKKFYTVIEETSDINFIQDYLVRTKLHTYPI